MIAVLLKNKQAVYVAHQSGLDITKHYDDVTGLALKALAEGLGDADELLDAFFTSLHLDAPEEEVRKALAARAWAYAFACEGDEAVWRSALDGAAIALPDACKNTYYYRCASRQAWSKLTEINTRDCWVDEAALAAALAETRPAPLASLPDAKRLATFLVNAAKVAASVLWP